MQPLIVAMSGIRININEAMMGCAGILWLSIEASD